MSTDALRQEMNEVLSRKLAEGFDSPEEVLSQTIEMMSDEHDEVALQSASVAAFSDALDQRRREQQSWPAVTDCDRLDAAFEELNALGIMARHNFSCCSTCARAEMPDEFERIGGEWKGKPIWGYVYYHQQNTESAAADQDGIYLGYGSTERAETEAEYEARSEKVALKALEVLAKHGLKGTWGGTYASKPHVPLNWQRRSRPPRFCGGEQQTGGCG